MSPPRNAGLLALLLLVAGCGAPEAGAPEPGSAAASTTTAAPTTASTPATATTEDATMQRSDEEWRKMLTPEQYRVLRQKGTERAFTGAFFDTKDAGTYRCAGCGTVLFESDAKFDSGCGWPSFTAPRDGKAVAEHEDKTLGMARIEVLCSKCGGHLGHVFDDGPKPTGLRYCINSASLNFEKKDAPKK